MIAYRSGPVRSNSGCEVLIRPSAELRLYPAAIRVPIISCRGEPAAARTTGIARAPSSWQGAPAAVRPAGAAELVQSGDQTRRGQRVPDPDSSAPVDRGEQAVGIQRPDGCQQKYPGPAHGKLGPAAVANGARPPPTRTCGAGTVAARVAGSGAARCSVVATAPLPGDPPSAWRPVWRGRRPAGPT